jgi:peptide/nickel transport system substrate-binding protein
LPQEWLASAGCSCFHVSRESYNWKIMRRTKGYITRQAQRLADGEINRRRFVMSALSAGVTMPTALSLASRAEAGPPRRGGVLRLATADIAPVDGPRSGMPNGFERLIAFARGNCLTERTAQGELVGELAEHFEVSDDHATWRFRLRSGVEFQNGRTLGVEDVGLTLWEHRGLLPHLNSVRADGPRDVLVHLAKPDRLFAHRLADPRFVVTSADGTETTGAYRLESVDVDRAILHRVHDYWKSGRAHFDAVQLVSIPNIGARQTALIAGEVDYVDQIDPRGLALLQRAPGIDVLEMKRARELVLSSAQPARIEEIASAIPYQALVDRILLGHGTPSSAPAPAAPVSAVPHGPVLLAVHDEGVPHTREAADLIAGHLTTHGFETRIVSPDAAAREAIHIKWQRNGAAEGSDRPQLVALWASDLAAHSSRLAHAEVAAEHENDGARLIERWWYRA